MPDFRQFQTTYNDYLDNPGDYSLDDVAKLAKQAQQFGVRFDPVDPGFSAVRTLKTFGTGLLSGFTTLPAGGKPTNEVESIAHSLGHLVGFIGGIPGTGLRIGALAARGIAKGGTMAGRLAVKQARKESIEAGTVTAASWTGKWMGKSVPMAAADYAMDKMGKTAIAKTMRDHVGNDVVRQMIRHGAHLGTASMVSGWSETIKEESVMDGFKALAVQGLSGAAFGAGFAAIGNIPLPGIKSMTTMDKALKGVAGATFQAAPGYFQGATTSENVYNFLLGAYFGSKTNPAHIEKAMKFLGPLSGQAKLAVETNKDFLKLNKEEQKNVIEVRDFQTKPIQTQAALEYIVKYLDPDGSLRAGLKGGLPAVDENAVRIEGGKHGGKTGTILKENKKTYRVKLDPETDAEGNPLKEEDPIITLISKDLVKEQEQMFTVDEAKQKVEDSNFQSAAEKLISEAHDADTAEIITLKPAQRLLEKMLGRKDINDVEYLSYLRGLNEIVLDAMGGKPTKELQLVKDYIKKAEQEISAEGEVQELGPLKPNLTAQEKKDMLLESASTIKDATDAGLELTRATRPEDSSRIGNIRTPEHLRLGGLAEKTVDAIKKEFYAKGRRRIVINANAGSEGFWEKMGFRLTGETKEGYPIDPSESTSILHKPDKPYGRNNYEYIVTESDRAPSRPKIIGQGHGDAPARPWKEVSKVLLEKAKEIQKARDVKGEEEFTEDDLGQFRQYYLKVNNSIMIPRKSFNTLTGSFQIHDSFDGLGNRIDRREPIRLINELAVQAEVVERPEDAFFVVKKIVVKSGGEKKEVDISDKIFETKDYKSMVDKAMSHGYYPYSGKGESKQVIFMKLNITDNPKNELIRIRKELINAGIDFKKEYEVLRNQAIKEMNISKEEYDNMFISNIRWWEAQNRKPISELMNRKEGRYLKDIVAFNKRQQPLFSDFHRLTNESFDRPFNYVLINDFIKSSDASVKKLLGKNSKIEMTDGAVLIRDDILQRMLVDMGLSSEGGFGKPFFNSPSDKGLLIGKLALHGAGPEMSKTMKDKKIDMIVPESVAKQRGERRLLDYDYDEKKGLRFSRKGKDVDPYKSEDVHQMEPKDIMFSFGIYDNPAKKLNDPIRVFKGIQDVLINPRVLEDPSGETQKIYDVMKDWMGQFYEGKSEYNNLLAAYLTKGKVSEKTLKKLIDNFDDIGLQNVNDALWNETKAGKAFREAAMRKIFKVAEPGMEDKSLEIQRDFDGKGIGERQSAAMAMLETGGWTDAGRLTKTMADYADRALTNYFIKRLTNPKVPYSGKAIMRMYDIALARRTDPDGNTSRLLKEKDVFFLDEGFRNKKIKGVNEKGQEEIMTIEKQWELYKSIKDKPVKDKMGESLGAVVVRSPMNSLSGLAQLEMAGFTGRRGGGILLHPDVMQRLGGADLDIDSANFYMNVFPKELQKLAQMSKNELNDIYDYANKNYATNKKKNNGMREIMELFIESPELAGKESQLAMYDPYLRMQTANAIQNAASKMRGVAVNNRQYMRLLWMQAHKGGGVYTETLKENYNDGVIEGTKIRYIARSDYLDLMAKSIAAVDISVDVGKFGGMVSDARLKGILMHSAFKHIEIVHPDGTVKRVGNYTDPKKAAADYEKFFTFGEGVDVKGMKIGSQQSYLGRLARTQSRLFSWNFSHGRAWTKDEKIDAARQHPSDDFSHMKNLSEQIQKLDFTDSFYARVSRDTRAYGVFFKQVNRILRKNPELLRYLPTDPEGNPYVFKIPLRRPVKKAKDADGNEILQRNGEPLWIPKNAKDPLGILDMMDMLSGWYFPNPKTPAYNHSFNIATAKGKKNLAMDNDAWQDFTGFDPKAQGIVKVGKRIKYLNDMIRRTNHFISNDLWDLASIKTINDIGTFYNIPFSSKPDSLSRMIFQASSQIKANFVTAYKAASRDQDSSPTTTAFDAIMRDINVTREALGLWVDKYNELKPEKAPEVSKEGANYFFESILLGSIGKGKDTRQHSFQPMFASKPVLTMFQKNYANIFGKTEKLKIKSGKMLEWFQNREDGRATSGLVRNIDYIRNIEIEFQKGLGEVPLDPKVKKAKDEIVELLKFYGDKVDLSDFVKMIRYTQGVGQLSDMTVDNLLGLRDEMRSWRYGKGWFRFMSRGKIFPKIIEAVTAGKIKLSEVDGEFMKVGLGPWLKPTETVASDHMRNDLEFIDKKIHPVRHVTKDKNLKTVFVDAAIPMSHMGKLADGVARLHELSNELGVADEKEFEKTIYKIRSIKNKEGEDKTELLVKLAIKEYEMEGAVEKRDELKDRGAYESDLKQAQDNVERFDFRRRESKEDYQKVKSEEFTFQDKILSGEEVIFKIKDILSELGSDYIYRNKIGIRQDFPSLLITSKNNKAQLLDLNIRRTTDSLINIFLEPGAEADPTKRMFSLGEAKYLSYENELDFWAVKNAKDVVDGMYRLKKEDVTTLQGIRHEMEDGTGNIIRLFRPLVENSSTEYRVTYLKSMLRFMRADDMFIERLEKRLATEAKRQAEYQKKAGRPMPISVKRKAMLDATNEFLRINEEYLMEYETGYKELGTKTATVKRYFEMDSPVPYKRGKRYSQYEMDQMLADGKVDDVFYLKERIRHDYDTMFKEVGYIKNHFPHLNFNEGALNRDVQERAAEIMASDMTPKDKEAMLESLNRRKRRMFAEETMEDRGLNEHEARSVLTGESFGVMDGPQGHKQLQLLGGNKTTGNMLQRKNNLDGYSYDLNVFNPYTTSINRAIASNLSSIHSQNVIRDFVKKNPMGDYTKDWEHFMRIYARDSMGSPTTATDEMLSSKTLNLRNTPWWWLSDQFFFEALPRSRKAMLKLNHMDKADAIDKELHKLKLVQGKTKTLNFDEYWKKVQEVMYSARDPNTGELLPQNIDYYSARLRALSQAEGKWALASLLARAKVSVANVMGGGTNLWVYTGARKIWEAQQIDIWRDINPNTDEKKGPVFRDMKDVWAWAHSLGVVEEMVRYEAGLQQSQYKKGNFNRFVSDAISKIQKDPNYSDTSLRQLAKEYKISDFVFNKAAWFMKSSERQLRTRSFLAGYLQARESMQPVEFSLNDPWLVHQGKKTIKATQFYYNAPYRPAFARSSVGKVFNRFKLWTWNSAKFRREIYQEAKYRGFDAGSPEFQRLQRLRQADAFSLGLASLLPYTMFDYSLPAPYSYMQDLADWSFGDEKQRERAYFGVLPAPLAPLHIIMPSILRGPEMVFGSAFSGQWDRLANYTLISYLPFGMMARDLVKAYQSPSMMTEFVTGVPLHRIQRSKQDIEKGKKAPAHVPSVWY